MHVYQRLGDLLTAKALITQDQLDTALEARSRSQMRLGEVLVVLGYVTEESITQMLADQYETTIASLTKIKPTPEALSVVTSHFALTRQFLPVSISTDEIHAVIGDPLDYDLTDQICRLLERRLAFTLAPPSKLAAKIERAYGLVPVKLRVFQGGSNRKPKIDAQTDRFALLEALNPPILSLAYGATA